MWGYWIGMCIHFVAFPLTVIILGTGINGRAFEHLHPLFVWPSTLLLIPHIFDYLLCRPTIYLAAAASKIYPSAMSAWWIDPRLHMHEGQYESTTPEEVGEKGMLHSPLSHLEDGLESTSGDKILVRHKETFEPELRPKNGGRSDNGH